MITTHVQGPVFDGRAIGITDSAAEEIQLAIGEQAAEMAREKLTSFIKVNVTGAEPGSFHVAQSSRNVVVTDNQNIKYGPWLEGTGSRNESTRFKGYHTLHQVTSEINDRALEIAEPVMAKATEALNG